jgi:ferrochelatase
LSQVNPYKVKVVIGQLGSPQSPAVHHVRKYLAEFLADPRVVDISKIVWFFILNLFVLPFRPKKSAKAYARIWNNGEFPLIKHTENFAKKLQHHFDPNEVEINSAFLLGPKKVEEVFTQWVQEHPLTRAQRLIVLPQFPQYSEATVASVVDKLSSIFKKAVNLPRFELIESYYNLKVFIDLSAKKINQNLKAHPSIDDVVLSFHGVPLRRITQKRDLYYQHCVETFDLIKKQLDFPQDKIHLVFQSRFGREVWLGPATDSYCEQLVQNGSKHIAVYCPSFVADCLETVDEMGHELKEVIESSGGELTFIECLNDDQDWVDGYAHYIKTLVFGNQQEYLALHYPRQRDILSPP